MPGHGAAGLTRAFPLATSRRAVRPGRLAVAPRLAEQDFEFGAFTLVITADSGAHLLVYGRSEAGALGAPPFRTPAGRAFLAGSAGSYRATGRAGHLRPEERLGASCRHQWLAEVAHSLRSFSAVRPAMKPTA